MSNYIHVETDQVTHNSLGAVIIKMKIFMAPVVEMPLLIRSSATVNGNPQLLNNIHYSPYLQLIYQTKVASSEPQQHLQQAPLLQLCK